MGTNGTEQQLEPALLTRLRHIDSALTALAQLCAADEQRLAKIEDAIGQLAAAIERRDALADAWLLPSFDLGWHLVQLAEIGRMNQQTIRDLAAQLTEEHAATRSAISMAVAAIELEATERGG